MASKPFRSRVGIALDNQGSNPDAETDEVLIPFDTEYTKLSADSDGMYFDLFMEGLQPERYYKLMFRVDNNDGINIYDEDFYFKVIR